MLRLRRTVTQWHNPSSHLNNSLFTLRSVRAAAFSLFLIPIQIQYWRDEFVAKGLLVGPLCWNGFAEWLIWANAIKLLVARSQALKLPVWARCSTHRQPGLVLSARRPARCRMYLHKPEQSCTAGAEGRLFAKCLWQAKGECCLASQPQSRYCSLGAR